MNPIDLGRGHDMRMVARLLADRTVRGPLLLQDDGEPLAVMIRHEAWAPRLEHFRLTETGSVVCTLCPVRHYIAGADLGQLMKGVNQHWRDTHRAPRPAPPAHPDGIPLTKVDTPRVATGPVKDGSDAAERLKALHGTDGRIVPFHMGRRMVGWWTSSSAAAAEYFILRDGRHAGPFAGEHARRQAAAELLAEEPGG